MHSNVQHIGIKRKIIIIVTLYQHVNPNLFLQNVMKHPLYRYRLTMFRVILGATLKVFSKWSCVSLCNSLTQTDCFMLADQLHRTETEPALAHYFFRICSSQFIKITMYWLCLWSSMHVGMIKCEASYCMWCEYKATEFINWWNKSLHWGNEVCHGSDITIGVMTY